MPELSPTYKKSVFTHLTLALTLAPALVFTGVSGWTAWQTQKTLKSEIINQINDDMASLSETYIEGGDAAVSTAIVQRLSLSPLSRAGAHYLFKSKTDTILSGDLTRPVSDNTSLTKPVILDTVNYGQVTARETIFKGGETLIVARENSVVKRAIRQALKQYFIGLLALLILSYGLARMAIKRLRGRIARMNATLDYVGQGHLDARLETGAEADELSVLSQHVNAMIARAERLLALRKRVTDQLAHEMRSPLTRLDASLLKIADKTRETGAIATAREELQNCVKLLDGLLDVSSLDAQQGDKRGFDSVNIAKLARDIVELFEPVAEEAHKRLKIQAPENLLVRAAPSQIGRLISNLIDNAIKYSDPKTDIIVDLQQVGSKVILGVKNIGPQILGAAREDVFTPFFRHPDMADRQGYGLGLALCRAIAARHEGVLEIEPNPQMTVFKLMLPAT